MSNQNRTYTIGGVTYDSPTQVAVAYGISGLGFADYAGLLSIPKTQFREVMAADYPDLDAESVNALTAAIQSYCASMTN